MAKVRGKSPSLQLEPAAAAGVSFPASSEVVDNIGVEAESQSVWSPPFGWRFREMDDCEGSAAVACVEPGISGRWVKGLDVMRAYEEWQKAWEGGDLREAKTA